MEAMDIQAVESKLSDVTVTAIPMSGKNVHKELGHGGSSHATISTVPASSPSSVGKDKDNGTSNMNVTWKNICKWNTEYSADSVEWCPVEPHKNVLVCGTYELAESDEDQLAQKQTRLGKIFLFVINQDATEIKPIQTVNTSGILDLKWCNHKLEGHAVLAAVTSIGELRIYRLFNDETLNLKLWREHVIGQDILALSLDWSTNKTDSDVHNLVVSDSSGCVTILTVNGNGIEKRSSWRAHGFEAWIGAFNYWNTNLLYSGGDDCLFKCFDVRIQDGPVAVNKSHEAGVTSIRSHVDVEHQLLTGRFSNYRRN